jgi:hypothetical protein
VLVPVRLDVTPLDAVVTIDGVVASATAQLEAGRTVTVSVSAEGYEALTAQKLVEPPELLIAAALKAAGAVAPSPAPAPPPPAPAPQIVKKPPQPPPVQAKGAGTLQLKTTPYWAQVTIDGRTYDEVTPMSVQLAAGRHEVTLSNPAKGVTKKVKVVVVADETTSRMIELE